MKLWLRSVADFGVDEGSLDTQLSQRLLLNPPAPDLGRPLVMRTLLNKVYFWAHSYACPFKRIPRTLLALHTTL